MGGSGGGDGGGRRSPPPAPSGIVTDSPGVGKSHRAVVLAVLAGVDLKEVCDDSGDERVFLRWDRVRVGGCADTSLEVFVSIDERAGHVFAAVVGRAIAKMVKCDRCIDTQETQLE